MKWLAHLFQFPADKLGIFPILISGEGCGKGTYCKLMKKLVGNAKYLETSQPESHVWGKFNFLMANAYFVYINEFGKNNQTNAEGRIKNILTDETMVIKGEGDKPYTIQSIHSFMGSTNNLDPTNTKKDDRRKWIIRCSDELMGNKSYFGEMNTLLNDEDVLRSFYDYLMTIKCDDIRDIDIPTTEYQEILQESNVDTIELFIKYMANAYFNSGYTSDNNYDTDNDAKTEAEDDNDNDNDIYFRAKIKRTPYSMSELYTEFQNFKLAFHIHNYECSNLSLLKKIRLWSYSNKLIETKRERQTNKSIIHFDKLVEHFEL
jgi:hypothetical protein